TYACLPRHFYHSTLKHERTLQRDAEKIRQGLRDSIISAYQGSMRRNAIDIGDADWTGDIRKTDVSGLHYEHGQVSFRLTAELDHFQNAEHVALGRLFTRASIDPYSRFNIPPTQDNRAWVLVQLDPLIVPLGPNEPEWDFRKLFVAHRFTPQMTPAILLQRGQGLFQGIRDYADAHEGRPGWTTSGAFWRMLYFSVVTQTTLGYGEIAPITSTARTLVAAQSIFGIILVGMFLNSVGQRILAKTRRGA
ncbi:MAG: potassium channel family protein, partial [Phycisphaerae bacterium]